MELVEPSEAARTLKVKEATLAQWRWQGKGPRFRKIGAAVRYAVCDLDEYVEQAARTSTSDPGPQPSSGNDAHPSA